MRRKVVVAAAALVAALPIVTACGSGYTPRVLNIYPPADGATFIDKVGQKCSADSDGAYKIVTTPLPKSADDQRLQLARRLAGNDPGLDLMGMDVVWTAEFADAGWIEPVPDALAAKVAETNLGGPRETAMWKTDEDADKRLYAIPTWTNTQLLWYRPDLMRKYLNKTKAPTTWDEMLADTEAIRAKGGPSYIMVQGKQYEGLMVWFNSVLASAGGSVVGTEDPNLVTLNDTPEHRAATVKALQVLKAIATAPGHDPSLTNSDESSARLGMETGSAAFEVNWPFVFSSMRSNAAAGDVPWFPEMQQYAGLLSEDNANPPTDAQLGPVNKTVRSKFDFALYPGVSKDLPTKTTLGGVNIAVASTSQQKDLAFQAAECLTNEAAQKVYSVEGGTPPTISSIYDDPDFKAAYPMGEDIRTQLETENAALRPASPVYQAISTLLTAKLSPVGAWDPETLVDELAEQVRKAIDGEGLIP
ncbi:extracellular solute-binding protein [Gordonia sp. OPL2]|uniref:extracellular solute-binding protein n=1 Tax=Gordonia sp. OPL2 TaxID=2486274 RepID=UPI0016550775|nr:extracellular solute-binding protein [Gordonia sp. OPL2]ROZ88877.1 extracellular solute-binding protein [Gordonia sp. OPL2]